MAEVSYRKRHGLKPYRTPPWPRRDQFETYSDYWFCDRVYWRQMRTNWWPAQYSMMSGSPRYWDIMHHTRPHRRKVAKLIRNIMLGKIDPEGAAWPLEHKPHIYYW